jgi:hypothetical protein
VSLLFPDKLRIHLAPGRVIVARTRKAVVLQSEEKLVPAAAGLEWRALLENLPALLDAVDAVPAVTLTLSSRLAPLAVLPWRDDVIASEQQALLASAHFAKTYGGATMDWECIAAPNGFGMPWVAAGMLREFSTALKSALQSARLKVDTIVPLAVDLLNEQSSRLPSRSDAWLLIPEADRLVGWYCAGRSPRWCVSLPLPAEGDEPIAATLHREAQLRGLPETPSALLVIASHPSGPLAERRVQRLFPAWRADTGVIASYPLHWLGGAR